MTDDARPSEDRPTTEPFRPDYDWTSTCPHEGEAVCPDECQCECHAIPEEVRP